MASPCSICRLPSAGSIDELLRAGRSVRSVAVELGLSRDALGRHARAHLGRPSASPPPAPTNGLDPLDELVAALRVRALAGHPSDTREYRLALAAQSDAQHAAPPRTDLASEPEWLAIRARLLEALEPFAEARLAVVDAIEGMG
jgi:hypothetical protein